MSNGTAGDPMLKDKTGSWIPRLAFLLVLAITISLAFLWIIRSFLISIMIAALLAALLNPLYSRFEKLLRGRQSLAAAITVLLSLILLVIPLLLFMGLLVAQALDVSQQASLWVNSQLQDSSDIRQRVEQYPLIQQLQPYRDEILAKAGQLAAQAGSVVAGGLAMAAKGTAGFLVQTFVMLFALFTFLISGSRMLDSALCLTPLSAEDKDQLVKTFTSVGRATLKSTVVIGITQGGLAGLAFWAAGISGAAFWGVLMAILSIIPGIGTPLVWVPAAVYLYLNGQTGAAVGLTLWCMLVVGSIDNVLRPRLVGQDTKMPDLLVLLTTLGGLALFGAAGILIGPIIGAMCMTAWRIWGNALEQPAGATDAGCQ